MSAGTLALTNGSAVITGTGTSFTTELAAGDFVVVTVGGIPYTLPVKTVDSGTALTLVSNFTGSTQAGAAWSAVPRIALNMVTAALVTQSAEALRGLNYDKQNWQSIFSGTGTVTVKLPDGSTFTGPAWNSFTTALNGKAKAGGNGDITSLSGLTTALSIEQGGTGQKTAAGAREALGLKGASVLDVGAVAGTVAAGNDNRLNTVNGKSGGTITGTTRFADYRDFPGSTIFGGMATWGFNSGTAHQNRAVNVYPQIDYADNLLHYFFQIINGSGGASAGVFAMHENGSANAYNGQWVNGSDIRIKDGIARIENPLEIMPKLKGCTWTLKANGNFGIGFIAQDVEKVFPGAVTESYYPQTFPDGTKVERVKALSAGDVAAALHHEAILALMEKIEALEVRLAKMEPDVQ